MQMLGAANRRLLANTRAGLFVSVFYGILDAGTGTLTYCNAVHNPPHWLRAGHDGEAQALTKTGMVLGVSDDVSWEQRAIHLSAGDLLVLYTDGVTDAENGQGHSFGIERLLATIHTHRERPVQGMQDGLLAEIHQFVGDAPQFGDITPMTVRKSA
jgi:sigma-B regulation protein RsbU (phosphoserine phosphatase)